ncbi:MAG: hypothetical protein EOM20_10015 [Spartobacteria bacterium]|nr:hypothetical protein [Spartobacteria bacterium]
MNRQRYIKSEGLRHLLILLGILAACLPPLWVSRDRQYLRVMEDFTISSAQETWLRQRGTPAIEKVDDAWLFPTINGRPRLRKPPLTVWLHLLAWMDMSPETATPHELAARARLLGGMMLLLTVAGTYWCGAALGGKRLAALAALCVGTMWFAQREGRTDAYDIHLTAFVTLSIAAYLWALQPRADVRRVRTGLAGFMFSGLFLGGAWMSKGPLALVLALLPLAVMTPVLSPRRWRDLGGLLPVLLVSALVALPWYALLLARVPYAGDVLLNEYRSLKEYQSVVYYAALVGLVMPWGLWLIAALFHPFTASERQDRLLRLAPWLWFISLFVFFSIPETKQQRYILPIVPATALMIAQVFCDHARDRERAMQNKKTQVLMYTHWGLLLLLSLLIGPFLFSTRYLCASGVLKPHEFAAYAPVTAALVGLAALTLALTGLRLHRKGHAYEAALLTACWMLVCSTAAWYGYKKYEIADEVLQSKKVREVIGNHPLYCFEAANDTGAHRETFLLYWGCEKFLFYLQRIAPMATPRQVGEGLAGSTHYVMSAQQPECYRLFSEAGYTHVLAFSPTDGRQADLWSKED